MGKVIGVCGFIGSGKGTVSDILVEQYGFEKLSFAGRLKDAAAALFDWPRDLLEGDTDESRDWREESNLFWTKELGREITPRLVLQLMGTDCMRKGFDDNIWMLIVKQQILNNPSTNFVVSDVRFSNERKFIQSLDGQVWRVRRGPEPAWIAHAIFDNRKGTNWMKTNQPKVHESEWRWIDYKTGFDQIIENNESIEMLHNKVGSLVGKNE
jgi:hypothetical protein